MTFSLTFYSFFILFYFMGCSGREGGLSLFCSCVSQAFFFFNFSPQLKKWKVPFFLFSFLFSCPPLSTQTGWGKIFLCLEIIFNFFKVRSLHHIFRNNIHVWWQSSSKYVIHCCLEIIYYVITKYMKGLMKENHAIVKNTETSHLKLEYPSWWPNITLKIMTCQLLLCYFPLRLFFSCRV